MGFLANLKNALPGNAKEVQPEVPYSEQIKRMRDAVNLTQGEFGDKLGIPLWKLQAWECGDLVPKAEEMRYVTVKCVDDYKSVANSDWGAKPITREQIVDPAFRQESYFGDSVGVEQEDDFEP